MSFVEFYNGCNVKEKAYIDRAEKHTGKNDMRKFIKAVRLEFESFGIEYSDLYQSMTVCKAEKQFPYSCDNDYFIGLNEWKQKQLN